MEKYMFFLFCQQFLYLEDSLCLHWGDNSKHSKHLTLTEHTAYTKLYVTCEWCHICMPEALGHTGIWGTEASV